MASITADFTGVTPQWLQTTQPMITSSFLDSTGLGWTSEVTTGGSATVITDVSRLKMPYSNSRNWVGSYVRMISGTALNIGALRQVQSYDPATGTVTVSPALPASTTAGDDYEMWNTAIFPQTVCSMLDRLVGQYGLGLPTYSVLSEAADFDMEQSGTAAWTGVNATLAKVPWTPAERGIAGKQALKVTTSSADGYAHCTYPIGVKGGNSVWISALFTPDDPTVTNTGFIQVVNVATGAVIDRMTTRSKSTVRLYRPIANSTITSTLIDVQFGSVESGVAGIWDDIVVMDANAFDAPLPYWMGTESAFKEVYIWRPVSPGSSNNEYDPALIGQVAQGWRPLTDAFTNGGQLRLRGNAPAPFMLFVQGVRFESPWGTAIMDTKRIDVPWATALLAKNYYQRLKGQTVLSTEQAKEIVFQYNLWDEEYKEHDRRVRSFGRTQKSPTITWVDV